MPGMDFLLSDAMYPIRVIQAILNAIFIIALIFGYAIENYKLMGASGVGLLVIWGPQMLYFLIWMYWILIVNLFY